MIKKGYKHLICTPSLKNKCFFITQSTRPDDPLIQLALPHKKPD